MDLIDLMQEKRFIGQEFLTWIWFRSEINSGLINLKNYGSVEIWFEDRISLDSGSGNAKQTVTCQGKDLDLAEAKTALREGKKVSQARLRIGSEDREWHLSIKSEGLELSGIRGPRTLDMSDEEDDALAGRLLDRIAVFREVVTIMDALFMEFMKTRFTSEWEEKELPHIRRWLER